MSSHLFAYGSLSIPAVMQSVTGRVFRDSRARLCGFERFMLTGRVYPGIREAGSGETDGRVYFDLDEDALARLDHFEADDYERTQVDAELEDGSMATAFVYVIPAHRVDLLSCERWDEGAFVDERLEGFLEETRRWMVTFEGGKG